MSQDLQLRLVINADGTAAVSVVKQTAAEVKALGEAQGALGSTTKTASTSAAEYVAQLRNQLTALQSSAAAFREVEAISRGATASQRADIQALGAQIDQMTKDATRFSGVANGIGGTLAAWVAPTAVLAAIVAMSNAIMEARLQVEKIQSVALFANAGDVKAAARDIAYVHNLVREFGLDLLVTSNSWVKFSAAARGGALAGQAAKDIFEAVTKASAALRMSSSETEGALLAVQQMMSKGNVQAEELRGQLSERLPGAFAIAARSMGITEKELNKLLETGQVLASDFLPKFAAELTKTLGDAPQRAAEGTQAAMNRLSSAWTELKQETSQVTGPSTAVTTLTTLFDNLAQSVRNTRLEGHGLFVQLANAYTTVQRFIASGGGADTEAGRLAQQKASVAALTAQMQELIKVRAEFNDAPARQGQIDRQLKQLAQQYASYYVTTTELGREALAKEGEYYRDRMELGEGNKRRVQELLDHQKASNNAYLKELAQAGDKKAKLALANKEIDDKFAKDLASGNRTLAEINTLRAAEYKKIYGGDNKQAAEAVYRETIATQERLQASIQASVKDEVEALKRMREAGVVSEQEYYQRVAEVRIVGQAQLEESINRELAAAQAAVARGDAAKKDDVAKYLGEQKQFGAQRKKIEEDTEDAILAAKKKKWAEEIAARAKHNEVILAMIEKTAELHAQNAADLEDKKFELSLLGKSEEVQTRLQALRQVELAERRALTQAYKDYIKAINGADTIAQEVEITNEYNKQQVAIRAGAAAQREATVAVVDQRAELTKNQQFWDGFFQSLKGGWKGVRDYVKNFFFDWLLKQLSQQFTMNIAVGASGGAGGGLSGILGALLGGGSGGASAGGGLSGILGSLLGGGGGGGILGSLLGSMPFVAGAGPIAAGTGLAGMVANMGFQGLATSIAQFANFIPVIGPFIALAGALLPGLLKNKEGLWFDFGQNMANKQPGHKNYFDTALGVPIQLGGEGSVKDIAPWKAQMQNLAQNFVDIFGQTLAEKAKTALGNWTGFSERGRGTEYTNGQEYAAALATESKDVMAEYFSRVFSVVDERLAATISAWTGTTEELTKYIQGILGVQQSLTQQAPLLKAIIGETINLSQVVDLQREGEALSDTFSRILNAFSITNSIAEAMGKGADAFGVVGIKSLEARERLIALSGGLQALTGNMTTYLEQFFTKEERVAMQQKLAMQQVEAGFSALGIAVPTSREAFRALVQGIDLTTVAGQELFAALIKIAPAFATAVPAKDGAAATEAVERSTEYLNNFFTEAERAAMQLAESGKAVDDAFALLGLSVPKTRDEFRALIESQDLTTESGRKTYNALMAIVGAFANVTEKSAAATVAINAVSAAQYAQTMQYQSQLKSATSNRITSVFGVIDSTVEGATAQLSAKKSFLTNWLAELKANHDPAYTWADISEVEAAIARINKLQDVLTRAGIGAPSYADALFSLRQEYENQVRAAQGNADLLAIIEANYQKQRAEILNGGVSSGLDTLKSTLRAWLNSLALNNQLTTLTPLQRLEEARSQYEAAITSRDAGKITSAADAYLREARDYFASGAGYNQIFAMVRAQVNTLANGGTVYVAPAVSTSSSANSGNAANAATVATAAATAATAAADATAAAVREAKDVLANIMATVNHTIVDESAAQRAADVANTTRIVDAVSAPSRIAV